METTRRILDMPRTQRPYERMEQFGPSGLTDAELLSILIRNGRAGENSLDLAAKILDLDLAQKGLSFLHDVTMEELTALSGIGRVKAMQILAAAAIGRRAGSPVNQQARTSITGPEEAVCLLQADMGHLTHEELRVVCLDVRHRLIRVLCVSQGGLFAAVINPRDIFRDVLKVNASAVIIAHNHPSGDPEPSDEDGESTRRMAEAGQLLGIRVLDHLVITADRYVSMKQRGLF